MDGAVERYGALGAGSGVLEREGEGASGRFCRRWGLGRMRTLGDVFLRVAFGRGWVSGVACLGMRNSCR